jgi:serine/threonine protein kinase
MFPGFTDTERDLVMSMIALDPAKRITARQALKHPYFNDL